MTTRMDSRQGVFDGVGHQLGDDQGAVVGQVVQTQTDRATRTERRAVAALSGSRGRVSLYPGVAGKTRPRCRLRHVGLLSQIGRAPGPVARPPGRCPLM
ncbi:hypothetical protein SHIRM173S_10322 [Streptomyces hirsutus]